jgi:lipoprotein-anchoring transpeptidase ErfK/SrfK
MRALTSMSALGLAIAAFSGGAVAGFVITPGATPAAAKITHEEKPHLRVPDTWRITATSGQTKPVKAARPTQNTMTINPGKRITLHSVPAGSTVTISSSHQQRFPATIEERKPGKWATSVMTPNWKGHISVTTRSNTTWRLKVNTKQAPSVDVQISPNSEQIYGVGMPLTIRTDTVLTPEAKAIVEDNLTLEAHLGSGVEPVDAAGGTWQWSSETEAQFRPATFWPANSTVHARINLSDIEVMKGLWGDKETITTLNVGKQNIIVVDLNDYTLTQYQGGKKKAELKTSGGKAGWETANGWKIVYEKYDMKRLYNPDPVNGWDVMAPWSMRVTTMGEFIHSAPWNPSIGYANTSHGCTNLTVDDAKWLYDRTQIGDPVYTVGGGQTVRSWDGLGGIWNVGADPMPEVSSL